MEKYYQHLSHSEVGEHPKKIDAYFLDPSYNFSKEEGQRSAHWRANETASKDTNLWSVETCKSLIYSRSWIEFFIKRCGWSLRRFDSEKNVGDYYKTQHLVSREHSFINLG